MRFPLHPTLHQYLLLIVACLLLVSCQQRTIQRIEGTVFGTTYHITYIGRADTALHRQVDSVLQSVNRQFSIFDTSSLLSQLNRGERMVVTDDLLHLLRLSQRIHGETGGAFDCTIQPLVELWGFGRGNDKHIVPDKQIDSVKAFIGCDRVVVRDREIVRSDPRIQFNFNAIAKGFAVDKVSAFLQSHGHADHIVEIGGEVVASGSKNGKPWKVGIQTPTEHADDAVASSESFEIHNQAVATSGSYRNYFEHDGKRYTHILNPVTGRPEESSLLSVTVIAPTCAEADAYATAFMVIGVDSAQAFLEKHPELSAWFICSQGNKFQTIRANH